MSKFYVSCTKTLLKVIFVCWYFGLYAEAKSSESKFPLFLQCASSGWARKRGSLVTRRKARLKDKQKWKDRQKHALLEGTKKKKQEREKYFKNIIITIIYLYLIKP